MMKPPPLPPYQTVIGEGSIPIDGQTITYTMIRSQRARQARLKLTARRGLVVILPPGLSRQQVPALVESKAAWIMQHNKWLRFSSGPPPALSSGSLLLFSGKIYIVRLHETGPGSQPGGVQRTGKHVDIWADEGASADELLSLVMNWYMTEARTMIPARVQHLAKTLSYRYGRVSVRNQQTRWGSCSSLGNLNFNWRLLMAPPEVLDYVIIHELCHLQEMNHSTRFWQLVTAACPHYEKYKHWLREYGATLTIPYVATVPLPSPV